MIKLREMREQLQEALDEGMTQSEFCSLRKRYGDSDAGIKKLINTAFDKLVPPSGNCPTSAGEAIRAMSRIAYRYYNDGDVFFAGYGLETAAPSAAYLEDQIDEYGTEAEDQAFHSAVEKITDSAEIILLDKHFNRFSTYEKGMYEMFRPVVDMLCDGANESMFYKGSNSSDCITWDNIEFIENQPRFDFELEIPQEVFDLVQEGIVTSRDIESRAEDELLVDELSDFDYRNATRVDGNYLVFSDLSYSNWSALHDSTRAIDAFWDGILSDFSEAYSDEYEDRDEMYDTNESLSEKRSKRLPPHSSRAVRRDMQEYLDRCDAIREAYIEECDVYDEDAHLDEDLDVKADDLADTPACRVAAKFNTSKREVAEAINCSRKGYVDYDGTRTYRRKKR